MFRRLVIFAVVLLVAASVVVFWGLNPGRVSLDFGFSQIETALPAAFVAALVAGWLFGLLSCTLYLLRLVNERRRLRKQLRLAEAEVSSLRSLPLQEVGD